MSRIDEIESALDRGQRVDIAPSGEVRFGPDERHSFNPRSPTIKELLSQIEKENRMNATRCKMKLVSISGGFYNDEKSRSVEFRPVTSGSEENKKFYSATPSGELKFTVSAEAAQSLGLDQGKIGSEFYVDITPAP